MTSAPATPPAGDGAAPPAGTGATQSGATQSGSEPAPGPARLARLEERVERLADAVAGLVPGSHAEAQQRTEDRLDRPSSVQAEVRAELERARQEQEAAAAAEREQSEARELREQVARLSEAPPRAPVPRRTRILGWGDPDGR